MGGGTFDQAMEKKDSMTLLTSQYCRDNRVGKRIQFLSFSPVEEGGF